MGTAEGSTLSPVGPAELSYSSSYTSGTSDGSRGDRRCDQRCIDNFASNSGCEGGVQNGRVQALRSGQLTAPACISRLLSSPSSRTASCPVTASPESEEGDLRAYSSAPSAQLGLLRIDSPEPTPPGRSERSSLGSQWATAVHPATQFSPAGESAWSQSSLEVHQQQQWLPPPAPYKSPMGLGPPFPEVALAEEHPRLERRAGSARQPNMGYSPTRDVGLQLHGGRGQSWSNEFPGRTARPASWAANGGICANNGLARQDSVVLVDARSGSSAPRPGAPLPVFRAASGEWPLNPNERAPEASKVPSSNVTNPSKKTAPKRLSPLGPDAGASMSVPKELPAALLCSSLSQRTLSQSSFCSSPGTRESPDHISTPFNQSSGLPRPSCLKGSLRGFDSWDSALARRALPPGTLSLHPRRNSEDLSRFPGSPAESPKRVHFNEVVSVRRFAHRKMTPGIVVSPFHGKVQLVANSQ